MHNLLHFNCAFLNYYKLQNNALRNFFTSKINKLTIKSINFFINEDFKCVVRLFTMFLLDQNQ